MRLGTKIQLGTLAVAAYSLASLVLIGVGFECPMLFNPFVALLMLVASPFFYGMGAIANRELAATKEDSKPS